MKNKFICMIVLFALVSMTSLAEDNQSAGASALPVYTDNPSADRMGTNLLYIIPMEQLGTNVWGNMESDETGEYQEQRVKGTTNQVIYLVKGFKEVFGEDWVVIPAEESRTLYRLVATRVPEHSTVLPPFHVDSSHYQLEALETEPVWTDETAPRKVMMKWAAWWQAETNATPVVLILLRF